MAQIKRSRLMNTSRVMREIWINKEISRIQIAKNLGLDKSTISSIVTELIDTGIIKEHSEGEAGPQGGRKPVYLTLNNSFGCVLGIEFRPESYTGVAVDLMGNIVYSKFELIRLSGANFKEVFLDVTERMRTEIGRTDIPLLGIGIGVSGVVDPQRGIIRYSIALQMEGEFDVRSQIADDYDLPLFLENDANACAWGELAFHRVKNLQDFLFLLIEFRNINDRNRFHEKIGVGIGIVINGRVHYGHRYSAGEFRSALCKDSSKGQFSLEDEEVLRIEEDAEVLHRFIRELSKNIAMMINTFNLSHVFLGGDIERYKKEVQSVLSEEIEKNWPYPDEVGCKIRFSSLGDKSVAYGAAGMVLHRLFTDIGISGSVRRYHPGGPLGVELINQKSLVEG
jgi:predicted NBD/HSP70 family sugar kinase